MREIVEKNLQIDLVVWMCSDTGCDSDGGCYALRAVPTWLLVLTGLVETLCEVEALPCILNTPTEPATKARSLERHCEASGVMVSR